MSKHLIKIESTPHGVLGVRHAGLDQQYCEAGEQVILKWQPDAKWGLQEAYYTDGDGNVTAIDLTPVKVDGKDVVVFTMPNANIIVGGTFKRYAIEDWTGDVTADKVTAEGNMTVKGIVTTERDIIAEGNITAKGDITADGNISTLGNIEVKGYMSASEVSVKQGLFLTDEVTEKTCRVYISNGALIVQEL